ncbi:hypothetical protein RCH10_000735 [Variovorax sp. GrIS 2.14]|uniref:VOC family protein n=1 Tax=Variovorax sp. GrIS 2.14 TaxID=3071709 RepID=UPI0019C0CAA4|nr:VOC family protein [Variovorax sp.]
MPARLDHLVIAAASLDEGVAWCEATLGVTPSTGGPHPMMGTHNRLLAISSDAFPQSYLEIIAINRKTTPTRAARLRRWFDFDDAVLQAGLARHGPHLIHFVARVADARASLEALSHHHAHIDRGPLIEAARDTAAGRLEWQITVRDDGQRLFYGALPTLIQWGAVHPVESLPTSGISLRSMHLTHPRADDLATALTAIGLVDMNVLAGAPNLVAVLDTPRGPVTLESKGL